MGKGIRGLLRVDPGSSGGVGSTQSIGGGGRVLECGGSGRCAVGLSRCERDCGDVVLVFNVDDDDLGSDWAWESGFRTIYG